MDDQILALYAKGLSTRDIVDAFKEMYDADISNIATTTYRQVSSLAYLYTANSAYKCSFIADVFAMIRSACDFNSEADRGYPQISTFIAGG